MDTNKNWIFGLNSGIDIHNQTELTIPSFIAQERTSVVSDSNGNILFYTNGSRYYDSDHVEFFLSGGSGHTRGLQVIPIDSCENEYFVLNLPRFPSWSVDDGVGGDNVDYPYSDEPPSFDRHLKIALINCNGPCSGEDFIFEEESLPENYTYTEKMVIIPHNGKYLIAIFLRKYINFEYVPGQGGATPPLIQQQEACLRIYKCLGKSISYVNDIFIDQLAIHPYGDMKVSSDFNILAISNSLFSTTDIFDINYGTDTISGSSTILNLSNHRVIDIMPNNVTGGLNNHNHDNHHDGIEFTNDNKFLYLIIVDHIHKSLDSPTPFPTSEIHRYNIDSGNLEFISTYDPANTNFYHNSLLLYSNDDLLSIQGLGLMQRGVDNKLYFAIENSKVLGVINSPQSIDPLLVGVNFQGFSLTNLCKVGLPNFIYSITAPALNSNDTINAEIADSIPMENIEIDISPLNSYSNCASEIFKSPKISIITFQQSSNCRKYFIKVCNCSSLNTIQDVKILKLTLDNDLFEIIPKGAICFGDILPCQCVLREFVIMGDFSEDVTLVMQIESLMYKHLSTSDINFHI